MLVNLWLNNLFLVAHILIVLALGALVWLYFDAYKNDRNRLFLFRLLGISSLFIGFSLGLILSIVGRLEVMANIYVYVLDFVGLSLMAYATLKEKIAGLPDLKKNGNKTFSINPFIFVFIGFANFILSAVITFLTLRKVRYGMNKQFTGLFLFWGLMSVYFFIQSLTILGQEQLVWLDNITRQFSIFWIISQIVLFGAAVVLFKWIGSFISFRVVPRLFFAIWQLTIALSIILAAGYSVFTVSAVESQTLDSLNKNSNLILFNIQQIKRNNEDLLSVITKDNNFVSNVGTKNYAEINKYVADFIKDNKNLDRVIVTDPLGVLIYNSDRPNTSGDSLTSNDVIKESILLKESKGGFIVNTDNISSGELVYQVTYPVILQDKVVGTISTVKAFDDNYLDILKDDTDQEVIAYVDGKRNASTILESDNLSRLENLPLVRTSESFREIDYPTANNIKFVNVRIATVPYYAVIIPLENDDNEVVAELFTAIPHSILIKANNDGLIATFIFALFLTLLSMGPTYYLARSLYRNLK